LQNWEFSSFAIAALHTENYLPTVVSNSYNQVMQQPVARSFSWHGRSDKPLKTRELIDLLKLITQIDDDTFRKYPEVIDGSSATYTDTMHANYEVESITQIGNAYDDGKLISISSVGTIKGTRINFSFVYYPISHQTALDINLYNADQEEASLKDRILSAYDKLFPNEPYSTIDKFLIQRGFQFKSAPRAFYMPNYAEMKRPLARQQLRKELGASEYGNEFEKYCASLVENELFWHTRMNVRFLSQGTGGDYDVLALSEASNDLIYIEAKTGINLDKKDYRNILKRHKFLRPAFTIIAVDLSKQYVTSKIADFLSVAAEEYTEGHAPAYETLSNTKACVVTTNRNIFITSNEDFTQSFARCMRYYDGVVRQTAYFS
jgi:hypothetical protein